ncbi:MAG: AMP-binding protein [Rhizobiaceae bacterium]|nr:AMP-binding protein [Rhizobiaceae bacterium]
MATDTGALDTFPKFLLRNAKTFGARPAMRHKDFGIWQTWTWADMLDEVRSFSVGLKALGLKRGDKVAVIGSNRPRLYWSFLAVQALGGVPIPVYADSVADEMVYVLQHAEVRFAIAQDQEQVDKLLSIKEDLPNLETIIYDWQRGLGDYDEPFLHDFKVVQETGEKLLSDATANAEADWLASIDQSKGEDLSVMLYTSGTTGKPKGVMLSYDNLVVSSQNANSFDNFDETDEIIAYLPLAWVGDHIFSYGQSLTAAYCVCCPESPDTVTENRREIAPTYFFAPPRVFEGLLTEIMVRMEDASNLKRKMFNYFLDVAKQTGERILNGEAVSFIDRMKYKIGEFLVYGPLKNRLGMNRMKVGYTAGEAIGPEIFKFYRSLGLNLKQLYGQTEASVYITAQPDGEISADTVGTPSPDVEIEIADSGEVMYRSPGVFMGYYKNDQATRDTKTEEGWVHTGDAGFLDSNGHLRIIDRAKDVGKLNNGSMFPPKYIENKLKFFPNIKEAVAIGDGRDFVAVMLNIDLQPVANWAERNNIAYASYQELANHPQVYDMMADHVDQVNLDLASEERVAGAQIQRFLVLHKELDADDGELTRTMKVRRSLINERYEPLINALYEGASEKFVETEVVFEDGRKGSITATVQIREVEPHPPLHQSGAMKEAAQ